MGMNIGRFTIVDYWDIEQDPFWRNQVLGRYYIVIGSGDNCRYLNRDGIIQYSASNGWYSQLEDAFDAIFMYTTRLDTGCTTDMTGLGTIEPDFSEEEQFEDLTELA